MMKTILVVAPSFHLLPGCADHLAVAVRQAQQALARRRAHDPIAMQVDAMKIKHARKNRGPFG